MLNILLIILFIEASIGNESCNNIFVLFNAYIISSGPKLINVILCDNKLSITLDAGSPVILHTRCITFINISLSLLNRRGTFPSMVKK